MSFHIKDINMQAKKKNSEGSKGIHKRGHFSVCLAIRKTCPCKIHIFFSCKNRKVQLKFFYIFFFCSKQRLWVQVRTGTASPSPQFMFLSKTRENTHVCIPCKPQFLNIKGGYTLHGHVFMMEISLQYLWFQTFQRHLI